MQDVTRKLDPAYLVPFFAALLVIAVPAFWPTYFAPGFGASGGYVHLHAVSATLWMLMLISQPLLIRRYQFDLHRKLGTVSYVLAPLVVISMLLLANYRVRNVSAENYQVQTYVLFLQFSLAALFATSYGLAIWFRKQTDIHARFMVCTALTLIDPIFARLFFTIHPDSVIYHQWFTYGLTDIVFIVLIWFDRKNVAARSVFLTMLALFLALQIPALLWLTEWNVWQAFARWFQSLPLT